MTRRHHFGTPFSFEYVGDRTYRCHLSETIYIEIEYRTGDGPTGWWVFGLTHPGGAYGGTSIDHAARMAAEAFAKWIERAAPA